MNHDAEAQKQAQQLLNDQQRQHQQQQQQQQSGFFGSAPSRYGSGGGQSGHGGLLLASSHGQGMMSPTTSLQAQLALSPVPLKETIGHGRSWRTLVFLARYVSTPFFCWRLLLSTMMSTTDGEASMSFCQFRVLHGPCAAF